jgi:TRAP transporter TAXI family solute receptor
MRSRIAKEFWLAACLWVAGSGAVAQAQPPATAEARTDVVIAGGPRNSVPYHLTQAICGALKADAWQNRCQTPATAGPVANLLGLRRGSYNFALAPADMAGAVLKGWDGLGDSQPFLTLRSVFSLHEEVWTIAVKADSGILGLDALKGRPIAIGAAGTADHVTSQFALLALGWMPADLEQAQPVAPALQARALCQGLIAAAFRMLAHPNDAIAEIAGLCPMRLLSLNEATLNRLIYAARYFQRARIAGGLYPGLPQPTEGLGVRTTLLSTADAPEETVYAVVRAVLRDLDAFKARHPALAKLTPKEMVEQGTPAPLHPAALRFYREHGLR